MNLNIMTIEEIRIWLTEVGEQEVYAKLEQIKQDKRKGVQQLLKQWLLRQQKLNQLQERWEMMNHEERLLRQKGLTYIAGVDEVGRGPLAGPVVTAAVMLPAEFTLLGLDDSKRLSVAERTAFAEIIKQEAIAYSIASSDAQQIDTLNIYQATKVCMVQAIKQLTIPPEYLLIDALELDVPLPQKAIIKGDAYSVSIAAASILAKVHRDAYMAEMALTYPQYGFERHVGYPTKEHIRAIQQYGPTPLHRYSFIRNYVQEMTMG